MGNQLAQATKETKPSGITRDEQRLVKALGERKLIHLPEDDFKNVMRYMFAVVGLKAQNFPSGIEKELLHTYIRENYGGHSSDEIRLAFDMAVQGKLDIDPRDVKCYENFSIIYFTSIMNAYRKWARMEFARLERVLPPPLTKIEILDKKVTEVYYRFSLINKLPFQWTPI